MKSLIIIPAFNESKNIPPLIEKIKELNIDYLVINDCSTDDSVNIFRKLGINYIDLPINMGLSSVTQAGFRYAYDNNYDSAIVIDGDGQHPPIYIKSLLDTIDKGYDYVVGSRYVNEKKPYTMRMIGSRIICFAIFIRTGKTVTDPTSGMRAVNRKIMQEFSTNMNYVAEPDALVSLIRKNYKTCEISVKMENREEGNSYFKNPLKSIKFMLEVIISILFL